MVLNFSSLFANASTVCVFLLLGVKGAGNDLSRIGDWRDRLFGLTERYATHQGLSYAMVLPAHERVWIDKDKFPLEKAEREYDRRAENRGYDYNEDLRRYIKSIAA